jgi:hypothetical protein
VTAFTVRDRKPADAPESRMNSAFQRRLFTVKDKEGAASYGILRKHPTIRGRSSSDIT